MITFVCFMVRMTRADAAKKIDELIHHLVEELLEPKKNNLESRPES